MWSMCVCVSAGAVSWPNRTEGDLLTPVRRAGFETHTNTHTYLHTDKSLIHSTKLVVSDVSLVVNWHWSRKYHQEEEADVPPGGCLRPDSCITVWLRGKGLARAMGEKGGGRLIV